MGHGQLAAPGPPCAYRGRLRSRGGRPAVVAPRLDPASLAFEKRVVVPSRTLERIALQVWKLSPRRVRYIPNGVDCPRFSAARTAATDWPGTSPVVGTVAALRPEKNLHRLLSAFRLVGERMSCRLLVAGEGEQRASLRGACRGARRSGACHIHGPCWATRTDLWHA